MNKPFTPRLAADHVLLNALPLMLAGGGCFSTRGNAASMQARIRAALDVQMVIAGLARSAC